jgi:hypothetical protein
LVEWCNWLSSVVAERSPGVEISWVGRLRVRGAVAGKVGGRPVIKGTRIEPDLLLVEAELGRSPEQTHEDFPTLPVGTIRTVQA